MSILKKIYDKLHPKPVEPPTTTQETQALAQAAVDSALADLRAARSQSEEVTSLVKAAEYQISRNHFAELVAASMGPKGA